MFSGSGVHGRREAILPGSSPCALGTRRLAFGLTTLLLASAAALPARADVIPVGGACTLVDAINAANSDSAAGGCPTGSGPDTLVLGGNVTLTAVADSSGSGDNGLPRVTSPITLEGAGFFVERDLAAPPFRIFFIVPGGALTLRDITVRNGLVAGVGDPGSGGAVFTSNIGVGPNPELELDHATLTGNRARVGGAIAAGGTLDVAHSTISENVAELGGGGIYFEGIGSIRDTSISGNRSEGFAGGVYAQVSGLTIARTTISDNVAATAGGGLSISESFIRVSNCTISGNRAGTDGGGANITEGPGGVDFHADHMTIVDNTAGSGSGVYFGDFGFGGVVSLASSIVAGNPGAGTDCDGSGPITDSGNNFAGDTSCGVGFATLVFGVDIDAILTANGGPTRTHALFDGSPAIDAAGACGFVEDQRGLPRDDGACDSGAFEFREPLLVTMESLSARPDRGGVVVSWTTAMEFETVGFRVLRESTDSEKSLTAVGSFVPSRGNGYSGASYEVLDHDAGLDGKPRYYIEDVDLFGKVTRHGPVEVEPAPTRRLGSARRAGAKR